MSILAQIIGLACLLFWGFWLCCKLRLPAGFAPLCGLCFCMVVLQLAGSCNQLWLGAQLLLVGAVLTLAQRRRHEILPQLLSPGVLAFCSAAGVLMAVFAIRQPEFQTWDEFSHWGIYFKSVFYQHRFAVWDTTRSLAHQHTRRACRGCTPCLRCPPPNTGKRMYCLSLCCRWLRRLLPCLPCRRSQPAARASLILSAPAWPHRRCFGCLPPIPPIRLLIWTPRWAPCLLRRFVLSCCPVLLTAACSAVWRWHSCAAH